MLDQAARREVLYGTEQRGLFDFEQSCWWGIWHRHDDELENLPNKSHAYLKGGEPMPKGGQGAGQGRGKGGGRRPENCVCANCGERTPHPPGKPCYEQKCPKCGGVMRGE